jgi:hypothetical protein
MQIERDALNTFDEWSGALDRILGQATAALQAGDAAQRVQASELLLEFVRNSPDTTAAQLDVVAKAAMDDLAGKAVGEVLASLSARTAELAVATRIDKAVKAIHDLVPFVMKVKA